MNRSKYLRNSNYLKYFLILQIILIIIIGYYFIRDYNMSVDPDVIPLYFGWVIGCIWITILIFGIYSLNGNDIIIIQKVNFFF